MFDWRWFCSVSRQPCFEHGLQLYNADVLSLVRTFQVFGLLALSTASAAQVHLDALSEYRDTYRALPGVKELHWERYFPVEVRFDEVVPVDDDPDQVEIFYGFYNPEGKFISSSWGKRNQDPEPMTRMDRKTSDDGTELVKVYDSDTLSYGVRYRMEGTTVTFFRLYDSKGETVLTITATAHSDQEVKYTSVGRELFGSEVWTEYAECQKTPEGWLQKCNHFDENHNLFWSDEWKYDHMGNIVEHKTPRAVNLRIYTYDATGFPVREIIKNGDQYRGFNVYQVKYW